MCKDREMTKDVLQLLFAELWEKRHQLNEIEHWNAYLRKAFYRKMLEELKRNLKTNSLSDTFDEPAVPSFEDLMIDLQNQIEQQRQLHDALENLSEQQRKKERA